MSFQLTLVTPLKKILENFEVTEVHIPTSLGEIEVLDQHEDLICELGTGPVILKDTQGSIHKFVVSEGFCEIKEDKYIILLAEYAESHGEVDAGSIQKTMDELKLELEKAMTPEEADKSLLEIKKAESRLTLLQ